MVVWVRSVVVDTCLSVCLCTQDNSVTLLHYVVLQYISKHTDRAASTALCQCPLPEPSHMSQAAAVDFDDLQRELDQLHAALQGSVTDAVLYHSNNNNL